VAAQQGGRPGLQCVRGVPAPAREAAAALVEAEQDQAPGETLADVVDPFAASSLYTPLSDRFCVILCYPGLIFHLWGIRSGQYPWSLLLSVAIIYLGISLGL
jgi:hypothetical protein